MMLGAICKRALLFFFNFIFLKMLFCLFSKMSIFCIIQKQDYKTALRKYRKALRYLDVCWEKEEMDEGESLLGIL
jgi:hypothetical protein